MRFILSAFADEAADALSEQLEALGEAGITHLEIRGVDSKNIGGITVAEARCIRAKLDTAGIKLSALGSPYGKIKLADDFAPHLEAFKRSLEVASILGAPYIRMFSFFLDDIPPEQARDGVSERLNTLLDAAQAGGDALCCHENEKGIYGDTAERCAELLQAFAGRLGCVYDPANFLQCGEDAYTAWQTVRQYITYYHIKDVVRESGGVVPAGDGDGQIVRILSELQGDEGKVFLTLEPHLQHFSGLETLEEEGVSVKQPYRFGSNRESFAYAAGALKRVLEAAGYKEENGGWAG